MAVPKRKTSKARKNKSMRLILSHYEKRRFVQLKLNLQAIIHINHLIILLKKKNILNTLNIRLLKDKMINIVKIFKIY